VIDWSHWHNEPYLIGGLVFLGWLYAILIGPLRSWVSPRGADEPYPRAHALKFYSALLIFYLAVGSPLDQIGERFLFSAHMVQHQVPRPLVRLVFNPIICGLTYTLIISVWHAPMLYGWALRDKFVHVIEHLMFFVAALLYWWPQLSPSRVAARAIPYPAQILYQLGIVIGMMPVYAYITFSKEILYPTYEYAPRIIANFDPALLPLVSSPRRRSVTASIYALATL